MSQFTVQLSVNGPASEVWALLTDDAFLEDLYRNRLNYVKWAVDERHDAPEGDLIRKVTLIPPMNAPAPVLKLLGPGFKETEESRLDPERLTWTWRRVPSTLADKIREEGRVRVEAAADGGSLLVAETTIECKVFGIGGLMESSAEKHSRNDWQQLGQALNQRLGQGEG
ncbi:DUF2505 family protein [Streptomyces roseoverticillatus]|uniref:DUF2505 family protein n=1 Tax=Streptomyces roseoverticillatus TaxID=66429 RepID=UPI0004C0DB7E|nr:DUF2505 family protein [Streptomyces roseoverticillatus]